MRTTDGWKVSGRIARKSFEKKKMRKNSFLLQMDEVGIKMWAEQGARGQINFQQIRFGSQWTSERTV